MSVPTCLLSWRPTWMVEYDSSICKRENDWQTFLGFIREPSLPFSFTPRMLPRFWPMGWILPWRLWTFGPVLLYIPFPMPSCKPRMVGHRLPLARMECTWVLGRLLGWCWSGKLTQANYQESYPITKVVFVDLLGAEVDLADSKLHLSTRREFWPCGHDVWLDFMVCYYSKRIFRTKWRITFWFTFGCLAVETIIECNSNSIPLPT